MSCEKLPENNKLSVAFIGGGVNSAVGKVHRIAIEMDQRFELVAGCFSQNSELNKRSAREYGVESERTYQSLDELLNNEVGNIDAIIILTPTHQHKKQVLTCLEKGLPVICEKALVSSAADASELQTLLEQKAGFLAVTYNYTGYPMFRELQSLIHNDKLGKIQQIHIEMPQEGFAKLNVEDEPIVPQGWRLTDEKIPTISLDLGVHLDLMIRFLVDEDLLELVAGSNTFGQFEQVIDDIWCTANYTNGLKCNIWYSKVALGYRNGLKVRVFGSKGAAEWYQEEPEYLYLADNHGQKSIIDRANPDAIISGDERYTRFKAGHPAGFIEAFANYYYDVADALKQYLHDGDYNNPYVFGINDAVEGIKMLEAIADSCSERRWINLK